MQPKNRVAVTCGRCHQERKVYVRSDRAMPTHCQACHGAYLREFMQGVSRKAPVDVVDVPRERVSFPPRCPRCGGAVFVEWTPDGADEAACLSCGARFYADPPLLLTRAQPGEGPRYAERRASRTGQLFHGGQRL